MMMMSPEMYYEENLRGRSQEEILGRIRSLKREINRKKRDLEDGSPEPKTQITPDPLAQIKCCRKYLEMAKKAYKEAGGVYEPSKAEKRDQAFNEALASMKRFVFGIGGFFDGYEKRTYTVSGERVLCDAEHSLYLKPSNLPVNELYTREEFLHGIAELHIGEWKKEYMDLHVMDGTQWSIQIEYDGGRRPVHISGSNAFPYNFDDLKEFLMITETDDDFNETEEPKLILLDMRWWYDDTAAFGSVEGDTFAELMVMDEDGRFFFILIYRMPPYEKILVSEYAMFDIFKHCYDPGTDLEYELDKIMDNAFEEYEYDSREVLPEDMEKSKFFKALMLARYVMHETYGMKYLAEEEAADFVRTFLEKDLLKMNIPEIVEEDTGHDKRFKQGFVYGDSSEDLSGGTTCIIADF